MSNGHNIADLTGVGKAAESAELVTKELRLLLYEFLSPVAKEAGESLASYFRFFRADNIISVFRKAKKLRKKRGLSEEPPHPRLLAPLIEKASLEDDDYLQDLWAALLATSNDKDFRPYFISVLSELSPLEAKICRHIYLYGEITTLLSDDGGYSWMFGKIKISPGDASSHGGIGLWGTPHVMNFAGCSLPTEEVFKEFSGSLETKPEDVDSHNQVFEAIENLCRLGMVERFSSSHKEYKIALTVLAANLIKKLEKADPTDKTHRRNDTSD